MHMLVALSPSMHDCLSTPKPLLELMPWGLYRLYSSCSGRVLKESTHVVRAENQFADQDGPADLCNDVQNG